MNHKYGELSLSLTHSVVGGVRAHYRNDIEHTAQQTTFN